MRPHQLSKKTNAFGLLEVLIAIAISAVVMVGALVISSKSIQSVRENELRDLSSSVLVRSLEVARSPLNYNFSELLGDRQAPVAFALDQDAAGSLVLQEQVGDATPIANNCPDRYRVNFLERDDLDTFVTPEFAAAYELCNQVIITPLPQQGVTRSFEVRSIVTYNIFGDYLTEELITYREEIINEN
ncbi:MAG: type II secretion system protein [Candidatus Dojkabacteria bacterium]